MKYINFNKMIGLFKLLFIESVWKRFNPVSLQKWPSLC